MSESNRSIPSSEQPKGQPKRRSAAVSRGTPTAKRSAVASAARNGSKPATATQTRRPKGARPKEQISEAELLAPLSQPIKRTKTTTLYRLGMVLVAVTFVLLVMIYLAIIAATAYGVYYHTVNHWSIINPGPGSSSKGLKGQVFLYFVPIVVGCAVVLFLIKPLFAPKAKKPVSLTLPRNKHPRLYAFVEALAVTVNAPIPRRIDVEMEPNASARLKGGLAGFLGNKLILSIGLPLVRGLSLRQLTGVLAHEFGHFSQGAGMRVTYVIRVLNHWFARVVYERDHWDEWLVHYSSHGSAISFFCVTIRGVVWVSRWILWGLMMVGHAVSGFMLRQMEFDADQYEIQIAGSKAFGETARELRLLGFAFHNAQSDLNDAWHDGRLADDLPALIMANREEIAEKPDAVEKINALMDEAKTSIFDTHPSDRERNARADEADAEGIFTLDLPATTLFADVDRLCRSATFTYYRTLLEDPMGGPRLSKDQLVDTALITREQRERADMNRALYRYFQGKLLDEFHFFLQMKEIPVPDVPKETSQEVARGRKNMQARLDKVAEASKRYGEARKQFLLASAALTLIKLKHPIRAKDFELEGTKAENARAAIAIAEEDRDRALKVMDRFTDYARMRLGNALSLLQLPALRQRLEDGDTIFERCEELVARLAKLEECWLDVDELHASNTEYYIMLACAQDQDVTQKYIAKLKAHAQSQWRLLHRIKNTLNDVPYPFTHAETDMTIGKQVLPVVPDKDDFGGIYQAADFSFSSLDTLYFRLISALAAYAEKVEGAIGLKPWEDPVDDKESKSEASSAKA
ncbi:Protease HtpX [Planctomycetes bacterium Pan216]|uniref:Protease HtpX n=1 Tax=Kolteria novifilia TaxID=2527975 RepID=A0A518BD30_9BACT|nr:Protease HtpX [Planctomycetes bacterium Pan216]